jgi:hypothetical protein
MTDELRSAEAGEALAEIRNRQQQVIDLATVPTWYWWAVGALMVILAVGVDTRTPVALGLTISAFVIGMLSATGMAVRAQFREAQLRKGLLDGRGVVAILGFVALIIGISLGTAFALRAANVSYPATLGCLVGGLVMGLGGPKLTRALRQVMLGNRVGSPR